MPHLKCMKTGRFIATIEECKIQDAKSSQAVSIACRFLLYHEFGPDGEWVAEPEPLEVFGATWIVTKDGNANQGGVEAFMDATGWDGELDSIIDGTFKPKDVMVDVESEVYNGKTQFRVSWIHPQDSDPTATGGGMRSASGDDLTRIRNQFASKIRSVAASKRQNVAPAAVKEKATAGAAAAPAVPKKFDKF